MRTTDAPSEAAPSAAQAAATGTAAPESTHAGDEAAPYVDPLPAWLALATCVAFTALALFGIYLYWRSKYVPG